MKRYIPRADHKRLTVEIASLASLGNNELKALGRPRLGAGGDPAAREATECEEAEWPGVKSR
jgi:hypothetical protein